MNRNRFIQGLKSNIQLSEKERKRIIRRSLQKYPWKTKCTVAMEEFAELQQQISKQVRGYGDRIGLLEEMADAYICLNFLESIFDIKPEDLQKAIDVKLERIKQEATDDAVNTAMILLLTLPLEVLMDHYWTKSYAKRIPKFTELVLEYYERWQNGELDMEKLKEDLWEYGGVKLVESEGEAT